MNRNQRRAELKQAGAAPNAADAMTRRGIAFAQRGEFGEAILCFRNAVALQPHAAGLHNNLGNALKEQGHLDEARACYRRATALQPNFPEALNNLGTALAQQGGWDEAAALYHRAIALRPGYAAAHNNLGNVRRKQGQLDAAIACARQAIQIEPGFADAHNSLGIALGEQGALHEAADCYRAAIRLRPHFPNAHFNLSNVLLAHGELAEGWLEYEWRWQTPQMRDARRGFTQPQWHGEPGERRTLLIHAEQGFGDTLQFCRYAPLAAARGWRVIMAVQPALVRLLRSLPGVDQVIVQDDPLPPFDQHCPMLSLPLALGTTLATIPGDGAYLQADPAQTAAWSERCASPGPWIGLAWAGSATLAADRRRSVPPDRLAPLLAAIPTAQVFSLQKGDAPTGLPIIDRMAEMTDFADTAALVASLDLVITVDTAIVHLAGALGTPVWLLDRFDPDWRWLLGRRDSPWYPALRIYRQPAPDDWDSVLAALAHDLATTDIPRRTM